MTRDDDLERLAAAVKELTEERTTVTATHVWTESRNKRIIPHTVRHLPLLVELAMAVYPTSTTGDDSGPSGVPGPRDPARLAAIDRLQAIEAEVRVWCDRLFAHGRPTLADRVRHLGGRATMAPDEVVAWLSLDACRWVTWAKVTTGWLQPAYAPHAPCPACDRTGGLRIRLEQRVGCCVTCGADWREIPDADRDIGSIYVLADHVRLYTEGETA